MKESTLLKTVICGVALVALASVRPALAQEGNPCDFIESGNPCVTHTFDGGLQTNKYDFGTHAIKITANFSHPYDLGIEFVPTDDPELDLRVIPALRFVDCIPYDGATSNTILGGCGYYHVVNPPTRDTGTGGDYTGDVTYTVLWDFPTLDRLHDVRLYRAPLDAADNSCTQGSDCYTQDITNAVFAVGDHNIDAGVRGTATGFSDFEAVDRTRGDSRTARVWIGLKNSDDVGTRFDLKAVVKKNNLEVSSGELFGAWGGSSGFSSAKLDTIPLSFPASAFASGDTISLDLSVRNSCVGSSHNSGTARLWFNDVVANSRVDEPVAGTLYLVKPGTTLNLSPSPGTGPKKTIDVFVSGRDLSCNGLYTSFGTWTGIVP